MRGRDGRSAPGDEVEYLSAIIAVQTEIARAGLDLDVVMDLVATRSQILTRACGAAVELREGDDMVYRAASGSAATFVGTRVKVATSLTGLCVRTGEVLRCNDSESDDRVDLAACRRVGLRSNGPVAPLHHAGQPVGVLKVLSPQPCRFDDRDVRTLQLMAGLIGAAMGQASEHHARQSLLVERTAALEALRRSDDQLAAQLDLARRLNAELEQANGQLAEMAATDALTGLKNRRHFDEALEAACARAVRLGEPLALILADVDDFKKYNDTHGHPAGDEVLRLVAAAFRRAGRGYETVARFGGEEFAVILPRTGAAGAVIAAERLRAAVEAGPWPLRRVTASFGVAASGPGGPGSQGFIQRARQGPRSSTRGRKWVTLYGGPRSRAC